MRRHHRKMQDIQKTNWKAQLVPSDFIQHDSRELNSRADGLAGQASCVFYTVCVVPSVRRLFPNGMLQKQDVQTMRKVSVCGGRQCHQRSTTWHSCKISWPNQMSVCGCRQLRQQRHSANVSAKEQSHKVSWIETSFKCACCCGPFGVLLAMYRL